MFEFIVLVICVCGLIPWAYLQGLYVFLTFNATRPMDRVVAFRVFLVNVIAALCFWNLVDRLYG